MIVARENDKSIAKKTSNVATLHNRNKNNLRLWITLKQYKAPAPNANNVTS